MSIADEGMARRAGYLISRWGQPSYLLRGDTVRPCVAAVLDYNPRARGLALEGAERVLIASPLAIEPDHELDKLIHGNKLYAIPTPIKGPRPADVVIYYDADIIFQQSYDVAAMIAANQVELIP